MPRICDACFPTFAEYRLGRFRGIRVSKVFTNVRFEFSVSLYTFGYSARSGSWMSFIMANDPFFRIL